MRGPPPQNAPARWEPLPTTRRDGIRYFDAGAVPPDRDELTVLFLHGLGNSLDFWTAVAPIVAGSTRVVAADIPGFGESATPLGGLTLQAAAQGVMDLLRSLDVDTIAIAAHSLGAYVALELARIAPEEVRHLILVDGTLFRAHRMIREPTRALRDPKLAVAVGMQFLGGVIPMRRSLVALLTNSRTARRLVFWPYIAYPERTDAPLLGLALRNNRGRSIGATLRAARATTLEELVRGTTQTMDIISGGRDRLINRYDIDECQRVGHVRHIWAIEECGHWPMIEAPATCGELIVRSLGDSPKP